MIAGAAPRSDSVRFADEEVVQVPLSPGLNHRLAGLVGPSNHLDWGRGIIRHNVDDFARLDAHEEIVEFRQDRRALGPDLNHVVIRESGEAMHPERAGLIRETVSGGLAASERLPPLPEFGRS